MSASPPRILYCHCKYAQVVPKEVKDAVLRTLCDSGVTFEAVADLCEMSARRDPALTRLVAGTGELAGGQGSDAPNGSADGQESEEGGGIRIAACFPRAVKWIFASAGAKLPLAHTEVLNMRTRTAAEICARLFAPDLVPNLPTGKVTAPAPATASEAVASAAADEAAAVTATEPAGAA